MLLAGNMQSLPVLQATVSSGGFAIVRFGDLTQTDLVHGQWTCCSLGPLSSANTTIFCRWAYLMEATSRVIPSPHLWTNFLRNIQVNHNVFQAELCSVLFFSASLYANEPSCCWVIPNPLDDISNWKICLSVDCSTHPAKIFFQMILAHFVCQNILQNRLLYHRIVKNTVLRLETMNPTTAVLHKLKLNIWPLASLRLHAYWRALLMKGLLTGSLVWRNSCGMRCHPMQILSDQCVQKSLYHIRYNISQLVICALTYAESWKIVNSRMKILND